MNKVFRVIRSKRAAVSAALVASSAGAMAAVPEGVTTALGSLKDDALTIAGLVLVALIAVYAFKFMRKGI